MLLAAAIIGLAAPSAALACSCLQMTPEEHVRSTPAVFEGRVADVKRSRQPGSGFDDVVATVEVTESWKGDVADRVQVHGYSGSSLCGYDRFPVGEVLVILAYPRSQGSGFSTNACTMVETSQLDRPLRLITVQRQHLQDLIDAAPRIASPVIALARHFENWGDFPAAARTYASVARSVPGLQTAHAGQGRAFFSMNRFNEAIPPLTRAVALQPFDSDAARLLGQARFLSGDRTDIAGIVFRGLKAPEMDLRGRNLGGKDFSDTVLGKVNFDGALLAGAQFARARMSGSFVGADLTRADFGKGRFGDVDFGDARLDGADFAGTMLAGAKLGGASLRGISGPEANMVRAMAAGAVFAGARLPLALMHNADLTEADFTGASLIGTVMAGAKLCGANFSAADLSGADLRGAWFDARTRFPAGFRPAEAGMVAAENANCGPSR